MQVTKKSIAVVFLLVGVLVFSAFVSVANPTKVLIYEYMKNAEQATNGLSDDEILNMVNEGISNLPSDEQAVLNKFTDEQIVQIARGTKEGRMMVESFTADEIRATQTLIGGGTTFGGIIVAGGLWGKTPLPLEVCPPKLGTCTPGETICQEYGTAGGHSGGIACEWTCGSDGKYKTGKQCSFVLCSGSGDGGKGHCGAEDASIEFGYSI